MRKRLFTLRMSNSEMTELEQRAFRKRIKVSEYARLMLVGAPAKEPIITKVVDKDDLPIVAVPVYDQAS